MQENVLPVNIFKRDVGGVWQTLRTIGNAVETCVRNLFENFSFEMIAQTLDPGMVVVFACELASRTKPDDIWNGRCSRSTPLLLRSAYNQRRQRNSLAKVECADALGRVQLMP